MVRIALSLFALGIFVFSRGSWATDDPSPANSPHSVAEIPCPAKGPALDFGLLTPQKDWKPPDYQSVAKIIEGFRAQAQIDPPSICRYRDENRLLATPSQERVVFLGDSITEGWKAAAPDLFSHETLDRGISGQNTSQMLLRFREDVVNLHPAVVHIMAGVNDMNTQGGTALTKSNFESMLQLAKANGIIVIVASLTPSSRFWISPDVKPAPQIVSLNAWLRHWAAENNLMFIDYHTPLANDTNGLRTELSNDGLHPNQRGYDIMTPIAKKSIALALSSHGSSK